MKPLTLEACKEIAAKSTLKVAFPIHGVSVVVKKLDLDELATVQKVSQGCDENDPDANRETEVMACALGIVDGGGNQPYDSDEGLNALRQLPDMMRKKIANAVLGLIGLDGVEIKNS